MSDVLLTAHEAAALLGYRTLSGFYRYVRRNAIASEKRDGHMRFTRAALLRRRAAVVTDFEQAGRALARQELRRA